MTDPRPEDVFPPGFFAREDESPDGEFYGPPRLVTHIDDGAIAAVSACTPSSASTVPRGSRAACST